MPVLWLLSRMHESWLILLEYTVHDKSLVWDEIIMRNFMKCWTDHLRCSSLAVRYQRWPVALLRFLMHRNTATGADYIEIWAYVGTAMHKALQQLVQWWWNSQSSSISYLCVIGIVTNRVLPSGSIWSRSGLTDTSTRPVNLCIMLVKVRILDLPSAVSSGHWYRAELQNRKNMQGTRIDLHGWKPVAHMQTLLWC